MGIKLKIESKREWLELYWDLWKAGLLKNVSVNDINLDADRFPIEIPIDISGLCDLLSNPMVKPYRKKIDATLHENLTKVIG